MSENGSVLNLRGFRIKKSKFSHDMHDSDENREVNGSSSIHNQEKEQKQPKRRRIITTPDSDSDEFCPTYNKTNNSVDEQAVLTVPGPNPTSPEKAKSSNQHNIYIRKNMKTPSILEKERQMKFLLEIYPNLEAMVIHDVLSKYNFNTDHAAIDLAKRYGKELQTPGYEQWKNEYQQKMSQANYSLSKQNNQVSKIRISETNGSSRKKSKRKRDEDDSDESGDELGGKYKDRRVYDSDEDSDVELSDELTGDRKRVFDFMQNATLNELQLMNSCSKKKAELVVECRPFSGWIDLVQKLENNKSLSTDMLNAAQQVLYVRNNIKQLMKKCSNLASQMERAVAAGAGVKTQPRSLSSALTLTSYQMVGLNWLAVLHAQGVNGILADEMGLGKTVQVISFLAYLKETGRAKSTHLVVVPASTLENWRNEFARWCPELRVFMYYGNQQERKSFRIDFSKGLLDDFDVLLTTYNLVGSSAEERKMFRIKQMHYVIFDEAHMLKNMNTQRYESLIRINAQSRLLLTGTPLQNNLLELMSLLIFVMPKMFAEKKDDLKSLFQKMKSGDKKNDDAVPEFEKEQIEKAKQIMKPFLLRRLKQDVLQDLPLKTDHIVHVPMAPTQKEQYETMIASFNTANLEAKQENEVGLNSMSMMTDLRKLSNHPLLLRYHYDRDQIEEIAKLLARDPDYKDTKEEYIVDDLLFMSDYDIHTLAKQFPCMGHYQLPDNLILVSGKFLYLDKKLEQLKEGGHRVLIFSQYVIILNILEDYMRIKKHKFLRLDGSTPVNIRQDLINEFTEDHSIFVFLLSTRAGGLGINLTAADTVIIHDIDFNPYNDKQAEDRCHRMGQTRPVEVIRLISQGTIEEGMLEMNREKLKLERKISDESETPDVKSVVRLLSSALGVDTSKLNVSTS